MSFKRLRRDRSASGESCAWSCGALSRLFWGSPCLHPERQSPGVRVMRWSVCDAWSLQSSNCLLPSFVCCLSCLLNIQLRRCLLITVKCAEVGGGSCLDDLREARLQDLLREKACPNCVSDHSLNARFGCDESSQECRSSDVSRSFEPNSRLACAEGCLCHAVLCEAQKRALRETAARSRRRPLPPVVPPGFCGREPAECGQHG